MFELFDDDVGFSIRNGVPKSNVALDDVDELMRQVVLTDVATSNDTGSNMKGWDRKDLDDQPVRSCIGDIETQDFCIFVPDPLKDSDCLLSTHEGFLSRDVRVLVLVFHLQVQPHLGQLVRLRRFTMSTFGRPPEKVVECLETVLPLLQLGRRHEFVVIVQRFLYLATVVTDTPQGLKDDIDEALMVHGTGQF